MKSAGKLHARVAGFTLIELMIVVAVIAVLAAIAIPNYSEHVRKSHRAQAKADLAEYMQLAERYHTVNNTYVGFALRDSQKQTPREGGAAWYTLEISPDATASTITIVATAAGGQLKDKCGNLSLSQAGEKGASKGDVADCW
ncbi:type IV pilin protein [Stenotrophomonas sp. MH1]|uniref:Type IV pilin protein n=1 Tax=Stenotrophomonas capsici TaxID=3110230 RepID=A0ABU5V6N0_9GAMM|nr:type IV pilin protein [Stenotrophomonas sp. MH1]MEA5669025.1 type IV pilin protein [Stenotrophomonas sp. MH1]